MFGSKKENSVKEEVKTQPAAPAMGVDEGRRTITQVRSKGMDTTNLKTLAEALSATSGAALNRLGRIAESLRGGHTPKVPERGESKGGFYVPLTEATSNLGDLLDLLDEIEVVLGIEQGSRGVKVQAPNLNGS